jgi:hypothetical protein
MSFVIARGRAITSSRRSQKCACGPSHDDDEALRVHRGSSYARESHGCACGSCCGADTCASRFVFLPRQNRRLLRGSASILDCSQPVKVRASVSPAIATPDIVDVPDFTKLRFALETPKRHLLPTSSFAGLMILRDRSRGARDRLGRSVDNLWTVHSVVCEQRRPIERYRRTNDRTDDLG